MAFGAIVGDTLGFAGPLLVAGEAGPTTVGFVGTVGFTVVSELVVYPVLVFVPRRLALLPPVLLFAVVLHPAKAPAATTKSNDKVFIDPPVSLKE